MSFSSLYLRARKGESQARELLASRFRERLERFVSLRMGPGLRRSSEPEDVVQMTYLAFFQRLERFPEDLGEEELLGYLLQISKWKLADLVEDHPEPAPMPSAVAAPSASAGPVTRQDDRDWTREQINLLPDKYREVMTLYYVEGRGLRAIALELDLSPNLVKQRLNRGRNQLKEIIGPDLGGERR